MQKTINGFKITEGDCPLIDTIDILNQVGALHTVSIVNPSKPDDMRCEVEALKQLDVRVASMGFDMTRRKSIDALRAIARLVFQKFKFPQGNGMDIGSGATGFMVEDLLTGLIDKKDWVQTDIHPEAVRKNRRSHPDSTILQGSYLNLEEDFHLKDTMDIITGLSSLDATHFIERAMGQVRATLKVGGMFLHIQDVRPGLGSGIRELGMMESRVPLTVYSMTRPPDRLDVLAYRTSEGVCSSGELFRRNLGRAIENTTGLELVSNSWVSATRPVVNNGQIYFLNTRVASPLFVFDTASAVVTVAKKIA